MNNEMELAWAAGFFDGEGTVTVIRQSPSAARRGSRAAGLMIATKQAVDGGWDDDTPPAVLTRFLAAVGLGRIGGPYRQRPTLRSPNVRQTFFMWYTTNGSAEEVLARLWPNLGPVKRADALRALAQVDGHNEGLNAFRSRGLVLVLGDTPAASAH